MILSIFLPCFIISVKVPKMACLFINEAISDEIIDQMDEAMKNYEKTMKEACKQVEDKEEKEYCKAMADSFVGFYYTKGDDIDKRLSKIPSKADYVFVMSMFASKAITIDFKKLKSRMSAFVCSFGSGKSLKEQNVQEQTEKLFLKLVKKLHKASFDGTQKSAIRLSQLMKTKNNKLSKSYDDDDDDYDYDFDFGNEPLNIVGDIKDKVPFITLVDNVKIVNSPLNSETVYLVSKLGTGSEKIESDFLIVPSYINSEVANSGKIKVKQYTVLHIQSVNFKYKVSYETSQIQVSYSSSNSYTSLAKIPYGVAESYGIIVYSVYIDINLDSTANRNTFGNVNVTISAEDLETGLPIFQDDGEDDKTIVVKTTGNWGSISKDSRPSVVITADPDAKIDADQEFLTITKEDRYSYKPKKGGLSAGAIAGIVIAVVVVVAVIVVVVIIVLRKKKNADGNEKSSNEGN